MIFTSKQIVRSTGTSYGLIEGLETDSGSLSSSGSQNLYLSPSSKQALGILNFDPTYGSSSANYCIWSIDNDAYQLLASGGELDESVASCTLNGSSIKFTCDYRDRNHYGSIVATTYGYVEENSKSLSNMTSLKVTTVYNGNRGSNITHQLQDNTKLIVIFNFTNLQSGGNNSNTFIPMIMMKVEDVFTTVNESKFSVSSWGAAKKTSSKFTSISVDSSNKLQAEVTEDIYGIPVVEHFTIVEFG